MVTMQQVLDVLKIKNRLTLDEFDQRYLVFLLMNQLRKILKIPPKEYKEPDDIRPSVAELEKKDPQELLGLRRWFMNCMRRTNAASFESEFLIT
jgi:hypothetical protein